MCVRRTVFVTVREDGTVTATSSTKCVAGRAGTQRRLSVRSRQLRYASVRGFTPSRAANATAVRPLSVQRAPRTAGSQPRTPPNGYFQREPDVGVASADDDCAELRARAEEPGWPHQRDRECLDVTTKV